MKWIEQIRVRSSLGTLQAALPALQQQLLELEGAVECAEIFCMQHALYSGDLGVVVVWRGQAEPHKTREGLMVAEQLQALGPIDHAVWVPMNSPEPKETT